MLDEKLKALLEKSKELAEKSNELKTEIETLLEKDDVEGAQEKEKEREGVKDELRKVEEQRSLYEKIINEEPTKVLGAEYRNGVKETVVLSGESETRKAINKFLHKEVRAEDTAAVLGVKTIDAEVVIPEEAVKGLQETPRTVTDLSAMVNKFKAQSGSGKYPILEKVNSSLNTTEELKKNPELAKPAFQEVDYAIKTYRGALPLSQESIQDAQVDLVGIVARQAQEQKVNTTNARISEVLKSFTAKTINDVDDIKQIINVDLDPAYNKAIVSSQSFYQFLDTLKDGNGRYLLSDPIVAGSPKTLLGIPVFVIADDLLGNSGQANAFVGDLKRAVLFADRLDITAKWIDNEIFGTYLQVATRFDVVKADDEAGYFLTQGAAPAPASKAK